MTTNIERLRRRSAIDWSSITIRDNYMFVTVFSDPELCRELLQRILGFRIRKVEISQSEKTLKTDYFSHAIRMDVYAADADAIYDIEMQSSDKCDLDDYSHVKWSVHPALSAPTVSYEQPTNTRMRPPLSALPLMCTTM